MKKHKNSILAVLVLVLLGVAYLKREDLKGWLGMSPASPTSDTTKSTPIPANLNTTVDRTKVLKYGDNGASVQKLQQVLNNHQRQTSQYSIFPFLVEDGVFGQKTEATLLRFYKKKTASINELEAFLKTQIV